LRVLIAEDDLISRRMLEASLGKWGYEVIAAENGAQAWRVLQQEDAPRLAVLDWMMPELEGTQVCERVRQRTGHPYTYMLLLTARKQKQDLLKGLKAGADDYLAKPVDASELRARLLVGERILKLQDDLIAARDALNFQATHDSLTTLHNRASILEALSRELKRSRREGTSVGVILADIDHFKNVNDTLGHLIGDAVLQEIARRMSAAVRAYDSIGRYGGEEFLVVVPAADALATLSQAERIRAAIEAVPVKTPAGPVGVTLSLGVAAGGSETLPDSKAGWESQFLLAAADEALYRAKSGGRNRVEVAAPCKPNETVADAPSPELQRPVQKH
jgi:two-component system cell cycle response regulator